MSLCSAFSPAPGGSGSASSALATTAWVDKVGSDATGALGRIDKPFLTIGAAYAAGARTLNIGVGTWVETLAVWSNAPVALFGAGITRTVVTLTFSGVDGQTLTFYGRRDLTLSVLADGTPGTNGADSPGGSADSGGNGGNGAVLYLHHLHLQTVIVDGGSGGNGGNADGYNAEDDGMGTPYDGSMGGSGGSGGNGGNGGSVYLNFCYLYSYSVGGGGAGSPGTANGGYGVNGGMEGAPGYVGSEGAPGNDGVRQVASTALNDLQPISDGDPGAGSVALFRNGYWGIEVPTAGDVLTAEGWSAPAAAFDPTNPGPIGGTTPDVGNFTRLNLSPTWNNAGTDFKLIYGRITNTSSGASSKLIDVALADGSGGFVVTKAGNIQLTGTGAYRQASIDVPGATYGALALSLNGSAKLSITTGSIVSNGVPIGSDWGGYLVLRDSGSSVTELSIKRGAGSPEGVVTANPGSIYLNSSGGPPYYKNTGTGNTGWVLMT